MRNESFALGGNPKVTLDTYVLAPALDGHLRPLVIVCPGGGFLGCSPSEGEPVALAYNRMGYDAAVLTYTTAKTAKDTPSWPQALRDLAEAVCIVRSHADEWGANPDAVVVSGFSAGGWVAAQYSCLWDGELLEGIGTPEERRPNAAVLCYPLVDYRTNRGMALATSVDMGQVLGAGDQLGLAKFAEIMGRGFLGDRVLTDELAAEVSPVCHVSAQVPPTFVWTTFGDGLLDPTQSVSYACELQRAGVPCELHVFQEGAHGLSLADATSASKPAELNAHVAHWIELAGEWLELTLR